MNISETTRHAIALTELVLRDSINPTRHSLSFEVTPQTEVEECKDLAPNWRGYEYRIIEVVVKERGEAITSLDITLLRSAKGYEWQIAMIEQWLMGWVSGSYCYRATLSGALWDVRRVRRIAYGHQNHLILWDPDWFYGDRRQSVEA